MSDRRLTLNVESSKPDASVGGTVCGLPSHPFISVIECPLHGIFITICPGH
ncbi:hypothetical protein ACP70R_013403 [Stipagrostis hirtigluma subsp. patula]